MGTKSNKQGGSETYGKTRGTLTDNKTTKNELHRSCYEKYEFLRLIIEGKYKERDQSADVNIHG